MIKGKFRQGPAPFQLEALGEVPSCDPILLLMPCLTTFHSSCLPLLSALLCLHRAVTAMGSAHVSVTRGEICGPVQTDRAAEP